MYVVSSFYEQNSLRNLPPSSIFKGKIQNVNVETFMKNNVWSFQYVWFYLFVGILLCNVGELSAGADFPVALLYWERESIILIATPSLGLIVSERISI